MRFIGNIKTTVGQVVKDLETIAKNHPDEVLTFPRYDLYNDNYVSGVRFLKELGFLLLESSLDEDDALTVKQLIKELKSFDSKQKIVAQDGWRLVNLEHNEYWDEDFGKSFDYFNQTIEAAAYGREIAARLSSYYAGETVFDIFERIRKNDISEDYSKKIINIYKDFRIDKEVMKHFYSALYDALIGNEDD